MRLSKKYVIVIFITFLISVCWMLVIYADKRSNIIDNWEFSDEQIENYGPFFITIPAAENENLLSDINGIMFDDEPDVIYVVLPDNVRTDRVVYYIRDGYETNYEARRVADFDAGDVYIAGKRIELIRSDIPVMCINTDEENMSFNDFKNTYDRDVICTGMLSVTGMNVPQHVTLKPRGNATWAGMHKKPFSIVLDEKTDLCGMGAYKRWNLLADAMDKSLLKNYTFLNLAKDLNINYEPDAEHVILFVNREFQGIYLLTTKIRVDKDSVALDQDDWMVIWGGSHPEQMIRYESKSWFGDTDEIDYPYVELIYPENDSDAGLKSKQKYIQEYVNAVEDETSDKYLDYLDIESFAKMYWVQEASMNGDAAFRSAYTYYDSSDDKLVYAPVWDFDYTLGTISTKPGYDGNDVTFTEPVGWKVRNMAYYHALMEHPGFEDYIDDVYYNEVRDKLYDSVNRYRTEQARIEKVAELDYKYWRDEYTNHAIVYDVSTYKEVSDIILQFYIDRIEWIDSQMSNTALSESG